MNVAEIDATCSVIINFCREVESMMQEQDQMLKELVPQVRRRERRG